MLSVEDPAAYRFIMTDDLYLLPNDNVTPPSAVGAVSAPAAVDVVDPSPIQTSQPVFNYLGENNKKYLILVHYTDEEHIAEPHLAALTSILGRRGLNLPDVAILNAHRHNNPDITSLKAHFAPEKLIVFGAGALPSGLTNIAHNKIIMLDGLNILYTFSFHEMMQSNEMKKTFWDQMKTL